MMVVVTAADPSGLFDTITVTITVTDQNEPPVISGETSVYYAEDRTDTVATYTAADPENGPDSLVLGGRRQRGLLNQHHRRTHLQHAP